MITLRSLVLTRQSKKGPRASCAYGGVLYNQLRGIVLLDGTYTGIDVLPKERDTFRAILWVRSQVGDDYFQKAPQEIIASQIGNQYLLTTSSQLRVAASRLDQHN